MERIFQFHQRGTYMYIGDTIFYMYTITLTCTYYLVFWQEEVKEESVHTTVYGRLQNEG